MSRIVNTPNASLHTVKNRRISLRALAALSAAAALVGWSSAAKADTYGNVWATDGNVSQLNSATAWLDETSTPTDSAPPTAADIAQFDVNTGLTAPTTFSLGQASTSWTGLNVLNPGAAVIIDDSGLESTNTLTLGATGVNVGSQSLTINDNLDMSAAQTWNAGAGQTLTVNGVVSGTTALNVFGLGTTVLTASNAYTGATAVNYGNLLLNFTAATTTNIVNSASALQLAQGTLNVNNATANAATQTFASWSLNTTTPGITTLNLTSSGGGALTVNLGAVASNHIVAPGAVLVINGVATIGANNVAVPGVATLETNTWFSTGGAAYSQADVVQTAGGTAALIQMPGSGSGNAGVQSTDFATVGLYDWAIEVNPGNGVLNAAPYQIEGASQFNGNGTSFYTVVNGVATPTTGNIDVQGAVHTAGSTQELSTVRFNQNAADSFSIGPVTSINGVLETPNVGAFNDSFIGTINDLEAGNRNDSAGENFVVYQNNTLGFLQFNDGLANTKTGTSNVTYAGIGTVVIPNGVAAVTTYAGFTYLDNGVLDIGNTGDLGPAATAGTVEIQGGALFASTSIVLDNGNGNGTNARPIALNVIGGTLAAQQGQSLTVDGVVSGGGTLYVGLGTLPGTGPGTANTTAILGNGTVVLTASNTYTGGTVINNGTLRDDNTTGFALGTGNVTVNSGGSLIGAGIVGPSVTVNSGGNIVAGDGGGAVGNLTLSNLTMNAGSTATFQFGATTNSEINVTNTLKFGASPVGIDLLNPTGSPVNKNGTYDLFAGANVPSAAFQDLTIVDSATNAGTGQPLSYVFGTAPGFITVTVAGGPSTSVWINPNNNSNTTLSWSNSSNWSGGVPNLAGDSALLGTATLAPTTISLDGTGIAVGQLTIQNSNPYTLIPGTPAGNLTLNNGSAIAAIADGLGNHVFDVGVVLASNTQVSTTFASDSLTFNNQISGAGTLTVTGPGSVNLLASNSYTGMTTIAAASALNVGNGTAYGSLNTGTAGLTNQGSLTINNPVNTSMTIGGPLTGAGSLTVAGPGTLILAGAGSTNDGSVNLNAGTTQLQAANALGGALGGAAYPALNFNGPGLLDLNGNSQTVSTLNGVAGAVIDNVSAGGTLTLTVDNGGSFGGVIKNTTGTVALTVNHGALVLNNSNSYSGTTTLNATIFDNVQNGISSLSTIQVNSGGFLDVANGTTVSSPITVSNQNEYIGVPGGGSVTLAGPINATNQYRTGSTNNTITFTGATTAGTQLAIFMDGQNTFAGTGSFSNSGGIQIGRSTNVAALTIMNNATVTATGASGGGGLSDVGMNVGSSSNSGGNENSSVTLTLQDSGALNLGATALDVDGDYSTGSTVATDLNGGTLTLADFVETAGVAGSNITFNGTTVVATGSDLTNGTGFFTNGTNTFTPSLFFPNLQNLTANVGTGGFILNNGGFNVTIAQALNGQNNPLDGGLTISGSGTVTLANNNSYYGNTTVTAGELKMSATSGQTVGEQNSVVVLNAGTEMDLNNSLVDVAGLDGTGVIDNSNATGSAALIVINFNNLATSFGGTIQNSAGSTVGLDVEGGGNTFTLTGANTYTGGTGVGGGILAITSDAAVNYGIDNNTAGVYIGGGVRSGTSGVYVDGGTLQFNNYASTLSLTGNNVGLGAALGTPSSLSGNITAGQLNYNGPGVLNLSGVNSYNGSTTLNAGTLGINSDAAIAYGSGGVNFNGGTLQFNNTNSTLALNNGNVNLGAATGSPSTLSGNVTGNQLTFNGPGKLILTGSNAYNGPTTVNGGTLSIGALQALPSTTSGINITAGSLQFAKGIGTVNLPVVLFPVIPTGGTVDVTTNELVINYSGSSDPITTIQSYLTQGYQAHWLGAGISSSAVANDNSTQSRLIYGLGYADGADGVVSGLSSGQIEILPTLAGDAKLAGNVNFGDFQLLAANFGSSAGWDGGNFTYGSVVNFGDFQLLAQNFGANNSGLTSSEVSSLNSFAAAFGDKLVANPGGVGFSVVAVPEPASLGLLAAGGLSLLARRRRKSR